MYNLASAHCVQCSPCTPYGAHFGRDALVSTHPGQCKLWQMNDYVCEHITQCTPLSVHALHSARLGLCTHYPVHALACGCNAQCTPWPVQTLPSARLGLCTHYTEHALTCARITQCTPWPVHALPSARLRLWTSECPERLQLSISRSQQKFGFRTSIIPDRKFLMSVLVSLK